MSSTSNTVILRPSLVKRTKWITSVLGHPPTYHCVRYLTFLREQNKISVVSNREFSLAICSYQLSRIPRGENHSPLQAPISELHHVSDGTIKSKHTPRQPSLEFSPIPAHLHLKGTKLIGSIRHASCADGIGDENGAFCSLRLEKDFDDCRRYVNTICNDVSHDAVIAQHRTKNSRLAMIKGSHGVKRVRGVYCTRGDSLHCLLKRCVGVTDARVDIAFTCVTNDLWSSGKLRSDCHHLQSPAARVENPLEEIYGRCD